MSKGWVSVVSVGLAVAGAPFASACAEPNLGSEPLPVVDDRRRPEPDASTTEPPKTTEPVWDEPDAGAPAAPGDGGAVPGDGRTPGRVSCDVTTTCATARKSTIASIPGDHTLVPLEMRGSTSEFVQLRITESSSLWYDLKIKATLVSPPGTNFDLLVYVPSSDVATDCSTFSAASSALTGEDVVRTKWTDSTFSDDSRTVVFEIRHVSGDCSTAPDARWVLKVQGYVD